MSTAIQSLDSLNGQILQYILSAYEPSPGARTPSSLSSPTTPTTDPAKDGSTHEDQVPSSADYTDASKAITKANLNLSSPAAHASMVIIRRLLIDAQTRFRRMVEDNRKLAAHIDSSIQVIGLAVLLSRG